jgi:hypothetical protein
MFLPVPVVLLIRFGHNQITTKGQAEMPVPHGGLYASATVNLILDSVGL